MPHFYEYLEFNRDEDREHQLYVYVGVQLEADTIAKIKALKTASEWLIMAEPYCPDCVEVVAYFQRISQLNPAINVKYVAHKDNTQRHYFDSDRQQQAVIAVEKIPAIFNISSAETELVLAEFPAFLKAEMAEHPMQFDALKADFRMGKFGKQLEAELVEILRVS
ncbi:thiol-disulfide isomerase [[Haemophilus] ducreyi]|uniref:thioredoxin family protein n=1 Tax=Haemophilus ducreyi TaxID=730 RepID=UPI0007CDB159|nr:thioredoxin family protein [[Haemophilus] ducreyi]ANF68293.1 thiol-disulfide isomerase [[Haemophilus] ducreyi]ANF69152.1 thiol-disulfide isomerase [[Haemophilus] ducreyi]